ncbi:probable rRNA-processing protein EBP2 homolog [Halyomorpha halys]|uniref:probable rRNA-processing protein EBP2 homolog n=1 Tax=Halyomorpha halys TaxID=286706 RepID=UPI0006D4E201|nr:probable rRNA-processing protein EBP2 homolog [Halyomorpha halys]
MTRPTLRELQLEELENYEQETDSDTEAIQEAFARGDLKPGLNIPVKDRVRTNNVPLLKEALCDIKQDLPWIERLDITNDQAALAPELALQIRDEEKGHNPLVYDELKRESVFYRQAQNAALKVLPKLKQLGLRTERPGDYFAEMAKSDQHMQKVKGEAIKKKLMMERIEKLREIRAQKKVQKALHAQAKVAKVQTKKQMLDEVKKYRKGETKSLAFLEPGYKAKPKANKAIIKRNHKNAKFGHGGKKRGLKRNTRDSTSGIERRPSKPSFANSGGKGKKTMKQKRPGKNARLKQKSKRKN